MPNRDRTGPRGQGARTGQKKGLCGSNTKNKPTTRNKIPAFGGRRISRRDFLWWR